MQQTIRITTGTLKKHLGLGGCFEAIIVFGRRLDFGSVDVRAQRWGLAEPAYDGAGTS